MANIRIPTLVCLFFSVVLGTYATLYSPSADGMPPPIFVLGDSTADVGTNSYLPQSRARANFPHNGIDFPNSRPTGRFSNGFNSADFLGQWLSILSTCQLLICIYIDTHKHASHAILFGPSGKKFGLKRSPPPFLSLLTLGSRFKKHLFKGVNFASGGAGLLDITGLNLVSLLHQLILYVK